MWRTAPDPPPPLAAGWTLLDFLDGDSAVIDTPLQQIVVGTVLRSKDTFEAACGLLEHGLPAQAAMLNRSLFEDVVVGHWVLLNREDSDWLVDRFFRHRDAIALHQARLARDALVDGV